MLHPSPFPGVSSMKKLNKQAKQEAVPAKEEKRPFCGKSALLDEPKPSKKMEKAKKELAFTKDAAWN